jgi:hypothetical protein
MAIAALAAGVTAAYVATRFPWTDNFTGLLGRPPIVHGRPTLSQPTGAYLFGTPLRVALASIALSDPDADVPRAARPGAACGPGDSAGGSPRIRSVSR